jgi:hypothetical protein
MVGFPVHAKSDYPFDGPKHPGGSVALNLSNRYDKSEQIQVVSIIRK